MIRDRLSLNDVEWGEFYIGGNDGLFNISATKSGIDKNKLNNEIGNIPYITRSDLQNGINLFVTDKQKSMYAKNDGNVLTIGLDTQTVFYQNQAFYTGQNIQILENDMLNKNIALFLIPLLKIQLKKFSWGSNGATLTRLKKTKILLPIDKNGEANWQFMEDYIKQEQKIIAQNVINYYEDKIIKTGFDLLGLEDAKWHSFKIKDIFEIKAVKGKTLSSYPEGATPYVSTSGLNNGVSGYVDAKDDISNEKCISIDPIAGKAFYHNYNFVGRGGAGSAINLLYNQNLDENNAQFILTMIEKVSREKASYGVALNGERLKNMRLTLPIDEKGEPHWDYMSKFMEKIEQEKLEKALIYIYIYIYIA